MLALERILVCFCCRDKYQNQLGSRGFLLAYHRGKNLETETEAEAVEPRTPAQGGTGYSGLDPPMSVTNHDNPPTDFAISQSDGGVS